MQKESVSLDAANYLQVEAAGRKWILGRSGNLEDLWNSMDADDFDEDAIPYWTEIWPASFALAGWLERNSSDIAGKLCLDAGCGLGLTALVGEWLGAKVAAVDNAIEALHYCRINALENRVPEPYRIAMDWRAPAFKKGLFQRIWAADILYEKRFMKPVADFIGHCLAPAGRAWIAEPGRKIFTEFLTEIRGRLWDIREVFSLVLPPATQGATPATARVWEITHPGKGEK